MSELLALGISHKTAPVAMRERARAGEQGGRAPAARARPPHDEVHEAVAISTCNRTEVYLVASDPVQAEADAAGAPGQPRRDPPDRARPRRLHAAQLRRRAPALPRRERPRVDDRRRERGAGPGPARLRARARRRHDRADDEPPVPGGARRPASACARETGDRPRARERVVRRGRARARGRRRPRPTRSVVDHRRGRDERADGAGARRPGRHDDLRRQPPRRPRPRAGRALRRAGRLARRAARARCSRPTSSSPRPRRRTRSSAPRSSSSSCARARRPLDAHRHRGPARHRAGLRRHRGRDALRHRRPPGRRARATSRSARASARAPRRSSRRRSSASRAGWRSSTSLPTIAALREHGAAIVDQVLARERGPLGERLAARPRAHRGGRARGDAAAAARADGAPEGRRRHAGAPRAPAARCASCSASRRVDARRAAADATRPHADVRPLQRRGA